MPAPISLSIVTSIPILVIGVLINLWSTLHFIKANGTPSSFNPPPKLVTSRPYGIVRNPMMEGQFLFFAGIGFLFDFLSIFIILTLLIPAIHAFTVFIEEPELKRRFGQEWESYCKNVPKWFPRFRRIKNKTSIK